MRVLACYALLVKLGYNLNKAVHCAERAEHDKQFNLLTEAAGELMSLGFEDIYQDNKEDIAANMQK